MTTIRLMERRGLCILVIGAMMLSVTGCETMKENKEAAIGAGIGGAAGAGIGAAVGGKKGAFIGGLAGAVLGGAIGHSYAKMERDRTQAVAAVGYRPEQGNFVSIEKAEATPTLTTPGETIKVATQYTVLTPNNDKATVREVREIRYQGKVIDTKTNDVQREQGTYAISDVYPVTRNAKAGAYEVVTTIALGEVSRQGIANFTVK